MNYNRQSEYEEISAHNDAFLIEWTDEKANKIHVGTAALHLNPELSYKLVWPFRGEHSILMTTNTFVK